MNIQYIQCDKCGRKIDRSKETYYHDATQAGYGSKHDGDYIEFDLCWDCFDNFIGSLKTVDIGTKAKGSMAGTYPSVNDLVLRPGWDSATYTPVGSTNISVTNGGYNYGEN